MLLLLGDLLQGFEEYRWRWKVADFPEKMPTLSCPLWEGEDPSGKDILVYCEQGYGDSIQFVRYIAPLSRNAVRVTVLADQPLVSLFRSIPGIEVPFPCVLMTTSTTTMSHSCACRVYSLLRSTRFRPTCHTFLQIQLKSNAGQSAYPGTRARSR